MKKLMTVICFALMMFLNVTLNYSQVLPDSSIKEVDSIKTTLLFHGTPIPDNALKIVKLLDFKDTSIKEIVLALSTKYELNIFVEPDIRHSTTIRLYGISAHRVLVYLAEQSDLILTLDDGIYKLATPEIQMPEPEPLHVSCTDGLLTMDVIQEELDIVIRHIARSSGRSIMLKKGVKGKVTGMLTEVPFEKGLTNFLSVNGFRLYSKDNLFIVDYGWDTGDSEGAKKRGRRLWVEVENQLIALDVEEADLHQVIREVAEQTGVDIFCYGDLKGSVSAKCKDLSFARVLDYLFKGTNFTYRYQDKVYFIGDKNISGIASTQLIRLNHIKVEGVLELLPASITENTTLKVIVEHNGIMAVGAQDVLNELKDFIKQIDFPIPQVLIEAIVVDFSDIHTKEFGIKAWMKAPGDSTQYTDSFLPGVNITASSDILSKSLQFYGPQLGLKSIGRLPAGFMVNLKALESTGKVNIRSQPQIATLNGHSASIKIGTTQYYKFNTERPIVGGNQAYNQVTQRFEKVLAEISLTITPWVSASGEITTEIHPEFSTPRGFDPDVPPTIDHRILESTVRLRDGETIILGGMIQTDERESISKVPILGDIPIIGKLFQSRSTRKEKSKLMIYITPHLMYSGDQVNMIRSDQ
ncbi:secretin and TonB N-terminal domain-containing protein [bacterium]|nr:secretin and TonB N-terminal domain-containing protein [bacterium]